LLAWDRNAADGRPSIAPGRLIRASLLAILFSIRSERQLTEAMSSSPRWKRCKRRLGGLSS